MDIVQAAAGDHQVITRTAGQRVVARAADQNRLTAIGRAVEREVGRRAHWRCTEQHDRIGGIPVGQGERRQDVAGRHLRGHKNQKLVAAIAARQSGDLADLPNPHAHPQVLARLAVELNRLNAADNGAEQPHRRIEVGRLHRRRCRRYARPDRVVIVAAVEIAAAQDRPGQRDDVVASAGVNSVLAASGVDRIIARQANQVVIPGSAGDRIIARKQRGVECSPVVGIDPGKEIKGRQRGHDRDRFAAGCDVDGVNRA